MCYELSQMVVTGKCKHFAVSVEFFRTRNTANIHLAKCDLLGMKILFLTCHTVIHQGVIPVE